MNYITSSSSFFNPGEESLFIQEEIKELEYVPAEQAITFQTLHILAEDTQNLIFWKDTALNLLGANTAVQQFVEKTGETSIAAVFGKHPSFIEKIQHVIQSGKVTRNNSLEIPAGNKQVMLQYTIYAFFNAGGQVAGIICIASDVSEHIIDNVPAPSVESRKLQELMQANEQLRKVNTDLDNFIYTASHDLRSPVANLEGLVTLLSKSLENKLSEEEKLMFNMMHKAINRFKGTIHDLTQLISIEKNFNEGSEELDLGDLLEYVQTDIGQIIRDSGAVITLDIQVPSFRFTRKNLRSIFYNLLINAIKYRSPDRKLHIHIKTQRQGKYVLLSIQDNGLGIRADQKDKLFAMFQRVHTHVEGTGIGLYVVKRIIDNNNGKIEVESEVGKGTTFYVYLHPEEHRLSVDARTFSSTVKDRKESTQ